MRGEKMVLTEVRDIAAIGLIAGVGYLVYTWSKSEENDPPVRFGDSDGYYDPSTPEGTVKNTLVNLFNRGSILPMGAPLNAPDFSWVPFIGDPLQGIADWGTGVLTDTSLRW
jgi:hypothetical protein